MPKFGGWKADLLPDAIDSPVFLRIGLGGLNIEWWPEAGDSCLEEFGDTCGMGLETVRGRT